MSEKEMAEEGFQGFHLVLSILRRSIWKEIIPLGLLYPHTLQLKLVSSESVSMTGMKVKKG